MHYMDCHLFFLSSKAIYKFKDLNKLKDQFDSSNLDENHELFQNVRKLHGKIKLEVLQSLCIGRICLLGAKQFSFVYSFGE